MYVNACVYVFVNVRPWMNTIFFIYDSKTMILFTL